MSKTAYNGTCWVTMVSTCDGGGDSTWADAFNESGDQVLEQVLYSYDQVGRLAMITKKERFHDESTTGDLGDPATAPKARVSYETRYDDKAHRLTSAVELGTNGGSAYTRPGSAPTRSDTALVTSTVYIGPCWVSTFIDPRNIQDHYTRTNVGDVGNRFEDWDGSGTPVSSGDVNRNTGYAYDKAFHIASMKANLPAGQNVETTAYVYGTSATTSDVVSNNLLVTIKFPNKSTGAASALTADQEQYTYNALGQTKTKSDGNGSVHAYGYDVLGRPTSDAITTLGSGVDGTIRRVETAYDTGGRPYLFTSYNAASGGSVVCQVWRVFNGLGQLVQEYQSLSGSATSSSPSVQYTYTEMAGGANHSRLKAITYPNTRIVRHEYNSGLDDALSRISFLADDNSGAVGTHLEEYSYLGLSRIVRRSHPEPGVEWTLVKQTGESNGDAGDQYTGLDRFGRLIDLRWLVTSSGTHTDRFQYAFDRVGNELYKNNILQSTFSDLYHANGTLNQSAYDNLNRLTNLRRGTLSASGSNGSTLDTVTTTTDPNGATDPIFGSQSWSLDQVGNWSSLTNNSGTAVSRTINSQNQVTAIGSTSYGYDNNGNLTIQTGQATNTWDAWNRPVSIRGTTYAYDARGRRVQETTGANTRSFFYNGDQVIETRQNTNTRAYEQIVYSLAGIDAVVLRDRDSDNNGSTGNYGISGSGLDERLYYQQDANLNVTAVINTSGTVVERMAYDPYGDISYFDASWTARSGSSYANNVGFTGRWHDSTGMIYYRNRYYEPVLGRFISRDPMMYVDGMSLYQHCRSNPDNFFDPMGLCGSPSFWDYISQYWNADANKRVDNAFNARLQAGGAAGVDDAMSQLHIGLVALPVASSVGAWGTAGASIYSSALAFSPEAVAWTTAAGTVSVAVVEGYGNGGGGGRTPVIALPAPATVNQWANGITSLVTTEEQTFFRVWGGDSGQVGGWVTASRPASTQEAVSTLALPPANAATMVSEVTVPAGTRVQTGVAAEAFGQPGGGTQTLLLDQIPPSSFGPGKLLPPTTPPPTK